MLTSLTIFVKLGSLAESAVMSKPLRCLSVFGGLIAFFIALTSHASAQSIAPENELSFYSGLQTAPHSRVRGTDPGGVGAFSFLATWEGKSFEAPPHYGFRYTRWTSNTLGFGIDFNHAKVYSDQATRTANGFTKLEFTDGLNVVTANAWRRWPGAFGDSFTPYVGAGIGLSIPHVDVETSGGKTFEYQVTGPAAMWAAGIKYNVNDRWGIFGEYKGTYSQNEADLSNGGTLSTDVVTNAINLGVTFNF